VEKTLISPRSELLQGINTPQEESLQHLEDTFQKLSLRLEELSKNPVRDPRFDLAILSWNDLRRVLQDKNGNMAKRSLLLTQVGYLRINLFQEYFERIQVAQKDMKLDDAVKLMKDYVETVAMQFLAWRLHPSALGRLQRYISKDSNPDAAKVLQDFNEGCEVWVKQLKLPSNNNKQELEDFNKLKKDFITLYTLSFSFENFPPVATEPSH